MKICAYWLLALSIGAANGRADSFQYLYLEANEGGSSGGHVAIQFGLEVFDYQYSDGLIRLFKHDAEDFHFDYRFLQNRTLHSVSIEVSPPTFRRLHEYFQQSLFAQESRFANLQAAQDDRLLLQWLYRRLSADNSVTVGLPAAALSLPGAGLFFSDSDFGLAKKPLGTCHTAAAAKTVLEPLRRRLQRQLGTDFIARRMAQLTASIRQLAPVPLRGIKPAVYGFSSSHRDLLNALLALRVIAEARPLTLDACFSLEQTIKPLSRDERNRLQQFQRQLLQSTETLVLSKRPDWGYALLVTLARVVALEQSLESGQWVFADDFMTPSAVIAPAVYAEQAAAMQTLLADAATDWRERRQTLAAASTFGEPQYSLLEMAANRYHEWQHGGKQVMRYQGERPLPAKSIHLPDLVVPDLSVAAINLALQNREAYLQQLNRDIEKSHAYNLITRNCVTEIFRTLNAATAGETAQRLGGVIDPALNLIPFAAFNKVRATYRSTETGEWPAYRRQLLTQRYAEAFPAWVYLREANIFTAQLYRYNPQDAWFVFFTDDSLWLRPLFGAVNMLAGVGQSVYGLLHAPFDGGEQLSAGARGVLMSLPELAFFNMRKGSYPFLSRRRALAAGAPGT